MFFSGFNELSNLLYYKQIQVVVQPMVEYRVCFMRVTKCGQMFLQADISSYAAENNNWIQLVVVFWFKHNITMRIYTKIQLILEFNLGFQGFANVAPTNQPRNTTYDWTWSWIFDIYNVLNATPCSNPCLLLVRVRFDMMVYQVVKYDKIQPMVESRISFVWMTKHGQMFLQPDMSSYVPENSGLIQP